MKEYLTQWKQLPKNEIPEFIENAQLTELEQSLSKKLSLWLYDKRRALLRQKSLKTLKKVPENALSASKKLREYAQNEEISPAIDPTGLDAVSEPMSKNVPA